MATDRRRDRPDRTDDGDSIEVVSLEPRRPRVGWLRFAAVAVAALLASGATLVGVRLFGPEDRQPPTTPVSTLDANGPASREIAGSTRLVLMGPVPLVDTRAGASLPAGASVNLTLPPLPAGSTAVLLEVSLVNATGPGAVLLTSSAGGVAAVRAAQARAQVTATAVVPIGPDGRLGATTDGGGQLFVNLIGAFEPAASASAGRIVALPATRVAKLVPPTDGLHDATIALADVAPLREAEAGVAAVAAIVLQVMADVGQNGGFVAAGQVGGPLVQTSYWSATSGTDRSRAGLLVVPVIDGAVHLHYEAGNVLTADVVGYITGPAAPDAVAGLVVLAPPAESTPAEIAAGQPADVAVIPAGRVDGVSPDRVAAALITAVAIGTGAVTVRAPDGPPPAGPTFPATGVARPALILSQAVGGVVEVSTDVATSVGLTPIAVVLTA